MSGYCNPAKRAALFGDTDLASSVPNRSRILSRATIPHPKARLSRETLPDPATPPRADRTETPKLAQPPSSTRRSDKSGRPSSDLSPEPQALGHKEASLASPLVPSIGPVYLEGRLVLSLSFRLEKPTGNRVRVPEGEPLLERYRIWDDTAKCWLAGGPCVLRFESADVVMSTHPRPAIAWAGALDVRLPVIGMPDLDERGEAINRAHHLRWRKETRFIR